MRRANAGLFVLSFAILVVSLVLGVGYPASSHTERVKDRDEFSHGTASNFAKRTMWLYMDRNVTGRKDEPAKTVQGILNAHDQGPKNCDPEKVNFTDGRFQGEGFVTEYVCPVWAVYTATTEVGPCPAGDFAVPGRGYKIQKRVVVRLIRRDDGLFIDSRFVVGEKARCSRA